MNTKHRIVAALLRLYPAAWRQEYGGEFEDLLLARPLTAAVAADVVFNGLRQRLRAIEPATFLGLLMLTVVTVAFVVTPDSVLQAQLTAYDAAAAKKGQGNTLFHEIEASQKAFAARAVKWDLDNNVNRRMAYNHYFAQKAAPKKA